jgi:hypothetical protein
MFKVIPVGKQRVMSLSQLLIPVEPKWKLPLVTPIRYGILFVMGMTGHAGGCMDV